MPLKPKIAERTSERRTHLTDEVARVLSGAPAGSYLSRADLLAAARHIIAQVQAGRWRAAHDIASGLHAEVSNTAEGVALFNGSGGKVQLTSSGLLRPDPETRIVGLGARCAPINARET
jgi:hypothetical protein